MSSELVKGYKPEYIESVRKELESRGWQPDSSGEPDCVDEASAAGADIIARLSLALTEAQAKLVEVERLFPMQKGPPIPWSLAERIYVVYSHLFGKEQTLQRLAERGGFGWAEVEHIYQVRGAERFRTEAATESRKIWDAALSSARREKP